MTGRRPTPTHDLKLHGAFRADRHGDRMDVQRPAGSLRKPTDIADNPHASRLWDDIESEHRSRGTLGQVDSTALATLCEQYSLYKASLALAKDAPTDKEIRCAVTGYLARVEKLGAKFGWTLGDRTSMKLPKAEKKPAVPTRTRAS